MDGDFDLVDAIDQAAGAASNAFWGWDMDTRKEYKEYARARQQRLRAESVVDSTFVDETEGDGDGDSETEATEATASVAGDGAGDGDGDGAEPPKPTPVEVKRKRWADYQQIARSELQEERGERKIPLKDVNERARRYYKADGWMQE